MRFAPIAGAGRESSASRVEFDRAGGQHNSAVGRQKRRAEELLLIVDPQFDLSHSVAGCFQADDLGPRQQHQAPPRIDVVPPAPSDVFPDGIEQQVGAAVLVEWEQPGLRGLALDRERRFLDRLAGADDASEPSAQSVE